MSTEANRGTLHSELDRPVSSLLVRWILWLFFIGLALLVVAVCAIGLFALRWWAMERAASAAVQERIARIQGAAEPATTNDLHQVRMLPPSAVDSTAAWQAAIASAQGASAAELPYVGNGDKARLKASDANSQLAAAEQFLTANDQVAQAIRDAVQLGGECRFPFPFEQGFSAIPSEASGVRAVVRFLALDVHVQAVRGKSAAALESLAAMFAASGTLSRELTLIEQQVRLATLSATLSQIEFLLNEMELNDEQLELLLMHLQGCDIQGSFTHSLIGERAMGLQAFGQTPGVLPRSVDCRAYLDMLTKIIDCSRQTLPAGRQQLLAEVDKFQAEQQATPAWDRGRKIVTAQLLPSLVKSFDAYAKAVAYRDLLVTAVAAERYRLKTGEFPAQLADLTPAPLWSVPDDPFTGRPLRFRRQNEEITIYSVGTNGIDDSAVNLPGNSGEPDIVVRVRARKGLAGP